MTERASGQAPGTREPAHIGPFRLVEVLGEGGMGTVWLAEQLEPVRRQVALKVVRADLDGDELLERFAAERQALALMSHPAIAQVYDAGRAADGQPWFAMEYVPGLSLTDFCDRRELDLRARLQLFADVCRGVHHAHCKGVLHRDLKPTNVLVSLVDGRPTPKIIDFGIAKALHGAPLAERGSLLGTPAYMSPEQAEASALGVDSRTDVYSLGVILYELLVGELPFDVRGLSAEPDELKRAIRERTPSRPSTRVKTAREGAEKRATVRGTSRRALARRVRGDLDWITLKALQKDPEKRYASASELAQDVERHLAGQPVAAAPDNAGYRARKFLTRHAVPVAAAVAVLLSLAGGLWVAWRQTREARDAAAAAQESGALAELRAEQAREATARAQSAEEAARAALDGERAARTEAEGGRLGAQAVSLADESPTLALLLAIEGAERAPGGETSSALQRVLQTHHELASFDGLDAPSRCVAISPDEHRLLAGDDSGLLVLLDSTTGAVLQRMDVHTGGIVDCGFLASGAQAFSLDWDGMLCTWDLATGAPRLQAKQPPLAWVVPAESAGLLCTGAADGLVRGWNLSGAPDAPALVLARHAAPIGALALSPDGRSLASLDASDVLQITRLPAGGAPAAELLRVAADDATAPADESADAPHELLQFTPDGADLLVRGHSGVVTLRGVADGAVRATLTQPGEFAVTARLAPDGRLAFVGGRQKANDRASGALVDAATGRRTASIALGGSVPGAVFAPDGATLLATDETGYVAWNVATGRSLGHIAGVTHGTYDATFFADARRFVVGGHDAHVHVETVLPLRQDWTLAGLSAQRQIDVVTTSPDGELAVVRRRDDPAAAMQGLDLVDAPSGRRLCELGTVRATGRADVRFDRGAARVALGYESAGGDTLRVWDLTARRILLQRDVTSWEPSLSPDGSRVAVRGASGVTVLSLRDGSVVATLPEAGSRAYDFELSSDGTRLATADGAHNTATLWDVATGAALVRVTHRAFVFAATLDPADARLLSFANDTSAILSSTATGAATRVLSRLPTSDYGRAAWAPDGRHFALANDTELMLFDADSGAQLARWKWEQRTGGRMLAFTPDGRSLLSLPDSGVTRFLPLDPLAIARSLAPRKLTEVEMETFGLGTPADRAARAAELEQATQSDTGLMRLGRRALDRHELAHAMTILEHAMTLRARPPAELRFQLARGLAARAAAPIDGSQPGADLARAHELLSALVDEGSVDRNDLALTAEFTTLAGRADFQDVLAKAKP